MDCRGVKKRTFKTRTLRLVLPAFLVLLIASPTLAEVISGTMQVSVVDNIDGSHYRVYEVKTADNRFIPLDIDNPSSFSGAELTHGSKVSIKGEALSSGKIGVSGITVNQISPNYLPHGSVGAAAVSGTRRVAIIITDFSDEENPCSASQIDEVMYTGTQSVQALYESSSRNLLTFDRDVNDDGEADIFGPFRISASAGSCDSPGGWGQAAEDALAASGVNPGDYQHIVAHIPYRGCS